MTGHYWHISSPVALLAAFLIAAVGAAPAAAQSNSQSRVEISANVGAVTGASKFTESEAFPVNAETETVTVAHGTKTSVGFNVGAAVRIFPRFWVGAQYAIADTKPGASITAVVPHPLLFNEPRTVQGSINAVAHNEQNLHVDLMYALPVPAVDLKVIGGPTFFNVKQDFVSAVTVGETYPFDTATFGSATTTALSKSAVGFNAGVDISRPVSSMVAVGALIRYSRGEVKFDSQTMGQQTVKAGGIEAGAGVRVRF
jgi:hypothetical protein